MSKTTDSKNLQKLVTELNIEKLKTPKGEASPILARQMSDIAIQLAVLADKMEEGIESAAVLTAPSPDGARSGAGGPSPHEVRLKSNDEVLSTYNMMAIHYMYAINLFKSIHCITFLSHDSFRLIHIFEEKISSIHSKILSIISPTSGVNSSTCTELLSFKIHIDRLREHTSSELSEITSLMIDPTKSEEFISSSISLMTHISEEMKSYVANLVSQASIVLGPPTCKIYSNRFGINGNEADNTLL